MFQKMPRSKQYEKISLAQNRRVVNLGIMTLISARFLLRLHPLSCLIINYCPAPISFFPLSLRLSWLSLVICEKQERFLG